MSGDHKAEWLSWVETWLLAAGRQAERIGSASYEEMQPDVLLFVQAVNNVRRGAARVLGNDHPDLANFDRSQPGLKDLRDMLEHFDEYVEGRGRRQREGKIRAGFPFIAMYQKSLGSDFKFATFLLADKHIEVHRLYQEAAALTRAVRLAATP